MSCWCGLLLGAGGGVRLLEPGLELGLGVEDGGGLHMGVECEVVSLGRVVRAVGDLAELRGLARC